MLFMVIEHFRNGDPGRTSVRAAFNGVPVSATIRFTDVFIKRNQHWQVVASHASSLAPQ